MEKNKKEANDIKECSIVDDTGHIDRRHFLRNAAIAAGVVVGGAALPEPVIATVVEKNLTENGKETGKRLGMVIDLRKCIGCKACHVACKSENHISPGVFRSWVKVVDCGKFPDVSRHFMPRLCMHCDKAPCEKNCPTGATYKDKSGAVLIQYDKCIGCGMCVSACPYRARYMDPKKETADKCTFCMHKVLRGELPACVDACRYGARIFGDLNDPNSEISKTISQNSVQRLGSEHGTEPKVYYIGLDEYTVHAKTDPINMEK
ncbi:MAG: 4Fe-4S dicluster domain-containing protein [Parcubacteria group bacterium]|nr:4Fe-4S dicluster domain-containing protein [Parcubacteria group bacterium]